MLQISLQQAPAVIDDRNRVKTWITAEDPHTGETVTIALVDMTAGDALRWAARLEEGARNVLVRQDLLKEDNVVPLPKRHGDT